MAPFLLLPALVLAFLVLQGWPTAFGIWGRAVIALVAVIAAVAAMSWRSSSASSSRFRQVRQPSAFDRIPGITAVSLGLVTFYFILLLGPTGTRQLSYYFYQPGETQLDGSGDEEADWGDFADELEGAGGQRAIQAKVRTTYDPNGSAVPSAAYLRPTDKPELRLKFDDSEAAQRLHRSGAIYVSAFAHSFFDGDRWTSPNASRYRILTRNRNGRIPLRESEGAVPDYRYTILHGRHYGQAETVNTLQGAFYIEAPEVTHIAPGTFLLPSRDDEATKFYQYEAASSPRNFTDLQAKRLPIEAGTVEEIYRAPTTDPELQLRIQGLSQRFDRDQPLEQRLSDLRNWLQADYSYSLIVNYPNNGKSALENFLGNPESPAKAGFCVHFASAAALLARELGVPSRICFGWTGGRFYEPHDQFVFSDLHAHAWTEIFLKDHGWVVFDATPTPSLPPASQTAPDEPPPALEAFLHAEPEALKNQNGTSLPFNWVWAVVICGAVLATLVLLSAFKPGRPQRSGGGPLVPGSPPPPGYLKLFLQACSRLGRPLPSGDTLWQHLKSLAHEDTQPPFADDLLTYHYDVTYRNRPRNGQTEKQLCDQIKSWSGSQHPSS